MNEELEKEILKLTTEFEGILPNEEEEKAELIEAFKKYLYIAVKAIQESTSKYISKDLESIKAVLSSIAEDFDTDDMEYVKRTLLKDEAFEGIRQKSAHIFEMAQNSMRSKTKNAEIDSDEEFNNMKNLFKSVKEYNQAQARELISEAILDLMYITSLSEETLSLRLYHYQETLKYMEVER